MEDGKWKTEVSFFRMTEAYMCRIIFHSLFHKIKIKKEKYIYVICFSFMQILGIAD